MSRKYLTTIVDVFAETKLAGNQLAVVRGAADLSSEEMQAIALETNFSETTFVLSEEPGRARVRIFTPTWELPFAGHPTIGTAWVLSRGETDITLELGVGPVDVEYRDGVGWLTSPEVQEHGSFDVGKAAELIGLEASELSSDLPVECLEVGPRFVIIPVANLDALKRAKLNGDLHTSLLAQGECTQCVFVVSAEPYDDEAHYATRMFFESNGFREDPATGSANCAFAHYLRKHLGTGLQIVVDQGVEMGRPSRIYLDIDAALKVGGKVQAVFQGELEL